MVNKHISEVCLIRVPAAIKSTAEALNIAVQDLIDLPALEKKLSIEDIFFLIYEQTEHKTYLEAVSQVQLPSFLSLPSNISWMSKVKNKLDKYIEQRKQQEEKNKTEVEEQLAIWDDHFTQIFPSNTAESANVILYFENTDTTLSLAHRERAYKLDMTFNILKALGYASWHTHPSLQYLLK